LGPAGRIATAPGGPNADKEFRGHAGPSSFSPFAGTSPSPGRRHANHINPKADRLLAGCANLFGAGGDEDSGSSGDGSSAGSERARLLEDLNVDTDVGERTSPDGQTLSADDHPTGETYTTFNPATELFTASIGSGATLYEDDLGTELSSANLDSAVREPIAAVAADFDGDAKSHLPRSGWSPKGTMMRAERTIPFVLLRGSPMTPWTPAQASDGISSSRRDCPA
jgi:hypothetical protein